MKIKNKRFIHNVPDSGNRKNIVLPVAISLFILIFTLLPVYAAKNEYQYRDKLAVPSAEAYDTILKYHRTGDLQKVRRAIEIIRELIVSLDSKYGQNLWGKLNAAIDATNSEEVGIQLNRLIYYDIKDLFNIGLEEMQADPDKAKKRFKAAYLEFILISPYVEKENFNVASYLHKAFRNVNILLSKDANYSYSRERAGGIDKNEIELTIREMETQFDKVFASK